MEIWKDLPGQEGRYQVSNMGSVRSMPRIVRGVSKKGREYKRNYPGVVLQPGRSRGYLIVNIFPAGTIAVHLLVARVFVEGFAPGLEANHKDGNKENCAASNLEWVTRSGNQLHAVATGLKSQAIRVVHPETGEVFHSIAQASQRTGRHHRSIATEWARA